MAYIIFVDTRAVNYDNSQANCRPLGFGGDIAPEMKRFEASVEILQDRFLDAQRPSRSAQCPSPRALALEALRARGR